MSMRTIHIASAIACALMFWSATPSSVPAQHNGDEIAFQGLSEPNALDSRALGRGGASTAEAGHIGALFSNPAGLARMEKFQIGLAVQYGRTHWREEQAWYQNRYYPFVPFLMEGAYVPDPDHDGTYFADLLRDEINPHEIENPVMGEDVFSEERADWTRTDSRFPLNHVAAALPVSVAGRDVVFGASYARQYDVSDFDRNDTFLDPHYGYLTPEVVAPEVDTLDVNWWRYQRSRNGGVHSITGALSVAATEFLDVGLRASVLSGSTDDRLELDQFGVLEFANRDNSFTHSDNLIRRDGTSEFSGMSLTAGVLAHVGRLQAGVHYQLPQTIARSWSYVETIRGEGAERDQTTSGRDEIAVPGILSLGLRVEPWSDFVVYGDVRRAPLSSTEFRMDASYSADTTYRSATHWADQSTVGFGVDYSPLERLTFRVGYRTTQEVFVPTGAAKRNTGPDIHGYTAGLSIEALSGRIDVAYEHRRLKYWDSYQSNTNYTFRATDRALLGFTLAL